MNKTELNTPQFTFFPSIEKFKNNQSQIKDDALVFIEDKDTFVWKQAYKASDRVGYYDTTRPICTLPKNWILCYIVYNWRGEIDWNSFNGAYLIPIHNDPVFFINFEIGLQVKPNGEVMLYNRGNAGDATVHAVYYF